MTQPVWQDAKNILCIRLDYLGDVLMTTPAMRALKQSMPGARITLLTSASGAQAARFIPEVDAVIAYAAPWMKSSGAHDPRRDLAMVEHLRALQFDAAVIFTVYSQNPLPAAMLCYLAGIPLRLAHCHENPYQLLTHWVRDTEPQERVRHEVQRQLDLVATVNAHATDERLSFRIPEEDTREAERHLRELGIGAATPWIVMHPGATAASRRYPPPHWRTAARLLLAQIEQAGGRILFTGSADEAALIEEIRAGLPGTHSLAGQLALGQLAALLALAPVLVSNNTGPAHLAAAVGTPVVDLYALTNPQHTPWQVPSRVLYHDVPCRFCYKSICPQGHHDCLTKVRPEQVAAAAMELLTGKHEAAAASLPVSFAM